MNQKVKITYIGVEALEKTKRQQTTQWNWTMMRWTLDKGAATLIL